MQSSSISQFRLLGQSCDDFLIRMLIPFSKSQLLMRYDKADRMSVFVVWNNSKCSTREIYMEIKMV